MNEVITEKKKTSVLLIVSIICVGLMYNANTMFTVLMNSIVGDFFGRGIMITNNQISMIISLPTLLMIPGVLISGKLAQYISMRTLVVVAWAIFGLTGFLLYFSLNSIVIFLLVRALMGFAIGLCQPISRAIPSKLFEGDRRAKILGYISMGGGILSIIMSLVFGQMALTNWRNTLWAFPILAILFIVLALAFIPPIPPEKKALGEAANTEGGKKALPPFGRPIWMLCLAGFCIYTIGAVIQIKTSVHAAQNGGGADFAGYISASSTAGIILGGFLFGTIYKRLKRWLLPVSAILTSIFYFIFATAKSLLVMCISGFFICGISIGLLMAFLVTRATFVAPKARITMAVTMVTFANYLGQFFTTYYIALVEKLFHAPLVDVGTGPQPQASISLTAVGVTYAIIALVGATYIYFTRNEKQEQAV
jgi:MFS family permease